MRCSILLLLPPLCLAALAGCWSRETAVERGNRDQVLHRGLSADVAALDPHIVTGLSEFNVVSALFEGLVAEDPHDLHPVPGMADSWKISSDGLRYTFHIRTDAKWSNGDPLSSQDFIASFQRVLTPSLAADYVTMLYLVQGAEAYHKGEFTDFSKVGFNAPDEHTLIITLEHTTPYFVSLLSHPVWFPIHIATLQAHGSPYQRGNPWTLPGNIVSNGPFNLSDWSPGKEIRVVKSPTYWDTAHVRLNAIVFHPSGSVESEERAFRAGQLHITEALPMGKVESYRKHHPAELRIAPFLDTYFYRLNTTRPFLNDQLVREALSLAIDREAIVKRITRGGQQAAYSFTPPGTAGYEPPHVIQSDPDRAREKLTEAGYPGGRGLPEFTISINTSGNHRVIAEAIQAMWRRELGIEVKIRNMEQKTLLARRRTLDFQILRSDWAGDYLDPTTFLNLFTADSGNNHTGWSDQTYDNLLYQAALTTDRSIRYSLLSRAEERLLEAMPIIPIYYYTTVRLVSPAVHGWYPTLLDRHPYKYVWLEP